MTPPQRLGHGGGDGFGQSSASRSWWEKDVGADAEEAKIHKWRGGDLGPLDGGRCRWQMVSTRQNNKIRADDDKPFSRAAHDDDNDRDAAARSTAFVSVAAAVLDLGTATRARRALHFQLYYRYYYIICLKIILIRARADRFFGIHSAQCLPDNKQYGFFLLFTRSIRPPCSTRVYFCIV